MARIAALAEQFADVGQERGLSDAACHQADVDGAERFGKAVAERAPDIERVARFQAGQQSRDLADDEIDDVDTDRLAGFVENGVVQSERPAQQRIGAARHADHDELAGADRFCQCWDLQAEQVRISR